MKAFWRILGLLLFAYTVLMISIELGTSQAHVRPYFSDIEGDVLFFAVNTSLSSFLLAGTSLLLAFAIFADGRRLGRQGLLFAAQAAFCLYMAFDDRFRFHEQLATALQIHDPYIMAAIALLNVAFYLLLFRPSDFTLRMAIALTASAAFFFLMLVFDALIPHDMVLRLSLEDLCKSWSGFFFLYFAWEAARFRLLGAPRGERGLRLPEALLKRAPQSWRDE